jgi:hypothetical protein
MNKMLNSLFSEEKVQMHEVLNIFDHKGNANQNDTEILSRLS